MYRFQCAFSWVSAKEASGLTRGLLDAAGDVLAMVAPRCCELRARPPLPRSSKP
jgi:hypothetical protein